MPSKWKQWKAQSAARRQDALEQAIALESQGRLDEARRVIQSANDDTAARVDLAHLLRARLTRLALEKADRAALRQAFLDALYAAWAVYPEPHTQIEADDAARWRAEDEADLTQIVGYDPRETQP